ncbi:aminoacetone oxidase family FAD-binding enzyme [Aphanothece hegewaldii CCALA 016]|uniref:Aminoacetone oxidase family FAD-binding enzyme n=1 Tax=Aphanothece hegewaldii CCALA 016 TaxID=2107694 RepID=A0A2T1LTN6_9CHRO|nr:NAD(P)/FAD-dependent oxidoreductase [Aphanothece hegewaldii]PSF34465.1 aminoacetone oxidase family FAD-binding enzyme [Aphanothece hegewaldii CCALA 016]
MTQQKVIVIGGGAAGFFGAITCGNTYPNVQVTLLEAGREPLAKVRISGGGRCNVTHHCFEPSQLINYYPRGGKALRGAFTRFQPKDTWTWFGTQGVKLKTEADGRMFPVTDNSQTIVNCLMDAANFNGVKLMTNTIVQSVSHVSDGFEVALKNGNILKCDRLLIATGSNPLGYRWAKTLGHTIEPPVPSLFTFQINDSRLKDLAGVSVENATVRLLTLDKTKLEQTGPVLITHWGLSGPAVLKLSAWGARILHDHSYKMSLQINWLSEYNSETIRQFLINIKNEHSKRKVSSFCPFSLPKRLWQSILIYLKINFETLWADLSKSSLNQLVQELTQSQYQITGKGVFKEEFVTCGGVSLKEIDFKTMESKICRGLYFAGEILDIDGVTGGFNFQSAWTTSWLAGKAIGRV